MCRKRELRFRVSELGGRLDGCRVGSASSRASNAASQPGCRSVVASRECLRSRTTIELDPFPTMALQFDGLHDTLTEPKPAVQ